MTHRRVWPEAHRPEALSKMCDVDRRKARHKEERHKEERHSGGHRKLR